MVVWGKRVTFSFNIQKRHCVGSLYQRNVLCSFSLLIICAASPFFSRCFSHDPSAHSTAKGVFATNQILFTFFSFDFPFLPLTVITNTCHSTQTSAVYVKSINAQCIFLKIRPYAFSQTLAVFKVLFVLRSETYFMQVRKHRCEILDTLKPHCTYIHGQQKMKNDV